MTQRKSAKRTIRRQARLSRDAAEKTEQLVQRAQLLMETAAVLVESLHERLVELRVHELNRQLILGRMNRAFDRADSVLERSPLRSEDEARREELESLPAHPTIQ